MSSGSDVRTVTGAVIAGMAWTHSGLTATAGGVPPGDS